ncbi:MAG: hypothetical protein ABI255_07200 [Microbacteriaceae bacterium]
MSTADIYHRILRRELHSPRSVLAITVSVVLILLCVYLGAEIVLAMLGYRALLATPQDMLTALGTLGSAPVTMPIIVGIVLMILGIMVLIPALTPGRRARHQLAGTRAAVVVDDEVIASALARHAAHAGNAHPDNTVVSISAHRAIVRVTPTSGILVREEAVSDAVQEQLAAFEPTPSLRSTILVASAGKVGG